MLSIYDPKNGIFEKVKERIKTGKNLWNLLLNF